MKLGNETIENRFDDIDLKVDFLIELCQTFQQENSDLHSRVKTLEAELKTKMETEELYAEQENLIQSKINGLLSKLDGFSMDVSTDRSSNI